MAKLIFYYGAMGSSKSANALMMAFNYKERGMTYILAKPSLDTRDGKNIIKSRIGLSETCLSLEEVLSTNLFGSNAFNNIKEIPDCIIVDEAQFATKEEINCLSDLVDSFNIPVICYGLRCDSNGNFFEGSKRLMEIADEIKEVKTMCFCGKKATINLRFGEDGEMISNGDQICLGSNDKYVAVCRKHFKAGHCYIWGESTPKLKINKNNSRNDA